MTERHWSKRVSSSRNRRVVWLVLLLLLATLVVWLGGAAVRQTQLDRRIEQGEVELNRLALQVESGITKYENLPRLLASLETVRVALQHPDPNNIHRLNLELEQINLITEASDSYIMDPTGLTIAASNWNQDASFVGGNFSFRPYFQNAMAGEAARYYALGTTSLVRGYYFSYPVYEQGDLLGVAVVKVDVDEYEIALRNPAYDFVLLDPDGVIFSTSRSAWLYRTFSPISEQEQRRILDSQRYTDNIVLPLSITHRQAYRGAELLQIESSAVGSGARDSQRYLYQEQPIQLLDFHFALLTPTTSIEEQVRVFRGFSAAVTIIVLLLVLAVMLRQKMLRERSVALQMSRHNQAYISGIIDNTQAGLITLNSATQIESFNPTAERLLGYRLKDLTLQPFIRLLGREDSQRFAALVGRMLAHPLAQEHQVVELSLLHRDGHSVSVELTVSDMRLPTERKFLLTLHDMTERKKYEAELQRAQDNLERRVKERTHELMVSNQRLRTEVDQHQNTQKELIQTAKLAVLGQMSAGINHELNQPLTAIRAYAENALRFLDKGSTDDVRLNLTRINELGLRMSEIIARFKVFSRKGEAKSGVVSLAAAVQGVLTIVGARLKQHQITVRYDFPNDTLVLGDTVYLEQVLVNVLSNAIDALLEHNVSEPQIELYLESSHPAPFLCLVVGDNGPGVPESIRDRVFEPFFTTKDLGSGLGLGLSITLRIVESFNGRIELRQGRMGGAEFCLILPRVAVQTLVSDVAADPQANKD